jgi:hypothetical protein
MNRRNEAVSGFGNGRDKTGIVGSVAQREPQSFDGAIQSAFEINVNIAGPKPLS